MASNRILFITPPTHVTMQVTPDLGIGFLASALREKNYAVDFIDVRRDRMTNEQITRTVKENDYLMVGVKVFSPSLAESNEVISAVRQGDPAVPVVIGGPHPTYAPEDALKSCPQADYGLIGEGDFVITQLADALEKEKNVEGIEALSYRKDGNVCVNPKKSYVDLENLPLPAWDLMDPRLYSKYENLWFFSRGERVAHISVSRGCPFKCTFCSDFIVSGRTVRYRKVKDVVDEIERLHTLYGVDEIHLTDSIFTVNRKYVYAFCEEIIRRGLKIHWASPYGTRLDTLDGPLLRVMKEAGCYGTSVGIESGSQRIMDFIKKNLTKETVVEKLNLIRETTDFVVQGFFILGYPTETRDTLQETIDFACSLPLDMAVFAPFRLTPGTEIAEYLEKHEPNVLPDWSTQTVEKLVYSPKGIPLEEMEQWNRKAYRAFYFRPAIVWKYMKLCKGKRQFKLLAEKFRRRIFRKADTPQISLSGHG